jgi:hypothetical protein
LTELVSHHERDRYGNKTNLAASVSSKTPGRRISKNIPEKDTAGDITGAAHFCPPRTC